MIASGRIGPPSLPSWAASPSPPLVPGGTLRGQVSRVLRRWLGEAGPRAARSRRARLRGTSVRRRRGRARSGSSCRSRPDRSTTWMIRVPGVISLYESVTMPPSAVPTARITSASLQRRVRVVARVASDAAEGERRGSRRCCPCPSCSSRPGCSRRSATWRSASCAPDWWIPPPARMIGRLSRGERLDDGLGVGRGRCGAR